MTNRFYQEAVANQEEIFSIRRALHGYAEQGFELPQTLRLVKQQLKAIGVEPVSCGKAGITALIGKPGKKTILLRADMDALPMREETGLSFASAGESCHSCGHDCHTAMLLAAAKLLKAHESELGGCVKLMFQPAEEQLAGAVDMVNAGLLESPAPNAALAVHMRLSEPDSATGCISYCSGPATFSGDAVTITVHGKDAHGSTPEAGVDAINVAAHIVIALQEIIAREISCFDHCVLLVGKIAGGSSCNTLAGTATLEVSLRTTTEKQRTALKARIKEIAEGTAALFRAKAEVNFVYGIAPMYTDPALSAALARFAAEVAGPDRVTRILPTGTEDFTAVACRVPSAFFWVGAGDTAQSCGRGLHHPAAVFDEAALPVGAAVYANCAFGYLAQE